MKMIQGVPDYILHWEAYDDLYYRGEFEALIKLQKDYVHKHPGDMREKLLLADAYSYGGKYLKALKLLKTLHKYDPYDIEYTHAIVECMYKLKLDPKTFNWRREVIIFEGPEKALEWCRTYMEGAEGPEDAMSLFLEMEAAGYVKFDEDQLVEYLRRDSGFQVLEVAAELFPKRTIRLADISDNAS